MMIISGIIFCLVCIEVVYKNPKNEISNKCRILIMKKMHAKYYIIYRQWNFEWIDYNL